MRMLPPPDLTTRRRRNFPPAERGVGRESRASRWTFHRCVISASASFDTSWEERYQRGAALVRYPYDFVVQFVNRYPPDKPREETLVLEVGCGAGNNLWFAAREGFQVAGIDGSAAAIAYARRRFEQDGLTGDLLVGDF